MPQVILLVFLAVAAWLIRKEMMSRSGISFALWVPSIWLAILASRPFSMWVGWNAVDSDSLEGNQVDALVYAGLIIAAYIIVARRNLNWKLLISQNKTIFLFYLYFLISVAWSEHPVSAFKRLFKDFGDIAIAMVILTEENPREAIKSVFVRCAYLLIPLSLVLIRYFPSVGRNYNIHSGVMEAIGVSTQKNSLGAMILVCGLLVIFDMVDSSGKPGVEGRRLKNWTGVIVLGIGFYLLRLCDSKTSIVCLAIAGSVLLATKMAYFRERVGSFASWTVWVVVFYFLLDSVFDIKKALFGALGRDETMTGRKDVWEYLLNLHTNPVIGMGFCTIWDSHFRRDFPIWMADSAHNGYLEVYLDGGWIGVGFLLVMLLGVYRWAGRQLAGGDRYSVLRYAVILITIIYNISESIYGRLSPGWFLFLLMMLEYPPSEERLQLDEESESESDEVEGGAESVAA